MSAPTAPARIKAVVSIPARRPKAATVPADPTCAAATTTTTTTSDSNAPAASATSAMTAATAATSGRPPRMQCPGCSSTNVVVEDEGETICHDCGLVLAEETVLTSSTNDISGYGLTRVNDIGRSLDHNMNLRNVAHAANMASSEDRRELYSSRSIADVKICLEQITSALGLPIADAHRALYLWTAFKNIKCIKVTKYARRASIACLYIAAKEAKREVTLNQLSIRSEINTKKLGSVYKDVKQTLLKHRFIHLNGNMELDPWTILDKILTLDNEASNQCGLLDDLPLELREAFGASLPPKEKAERLQKLLRASQRCMTLAIEADMMTGRLPIPLAGACVAIAVQVEGKILLCPDELFEFIAKVWLAAPSTIKKRYMELKKYMLECVNKLPYDVGGNRKTRPLFSLTGVLGYPLFFDKPQEDLWSGPDTLSEDSDGDADGQEYVDEDLEEDPAEGPGENLVEGSAEPDRVNAVEPIKPVEETEMVEEVEEIVGEVEDTHMGLKRKLDTLEMNSPPKKLRWNELQHQEHKHEEEEEDGEEEEEEEDAVEQGDFDHDHDQDYGYDYDGDDD